MPRDGAIIFRDQVGKLGRYRLDRLIKRYGIDAKLSDWEPEADLPKVV